MTAWQEISGSITAPQGYRAAGICAGLKPSGLPDLALIVSDTPATGAGVFTTSHVRAACVDFDRQVLREGKQIRAILCNAGQANACTGEEGWRNAVECAERVQQALHTSDAVLVASTGTIGVQLPMDRMRAGIQQVVAALTPAGGDAAARAILTTDTVPKTIAMACELDGHPVRLGGMAKGAGMIHPNMATMLGFITCDAAVAPELWQAMLSRAADRSFNQITVDGDTSTNDSLIALANGCSGAPIVADPASEAAATLEAGLTQVCAHLAKAIARDGEGATCLVEVVVTGAEDERSARLIARTIAGSSLVKAAVFGRDPNWGRIAAAAGRAGVAFDAAQLHVKLGDFPMMTAGTPQAFDRAAASAYLKGDTVRIEVSVGNGSGMGVAWGCDLSYDYVKINADYTT